MAAHTPEKHTFADAVMMGSTPDQRLLTEQPTSRKMERRANQHRCTVCGFRSRLISRMAQHSNSADTDAGLHEECSGASLFSTGYANALRLNAEHGPGLLGGAPSSASNHSSPRALFEEAGTSLPDSPPSSAQVPACAAHLSDMMARLSETTDPEQLGDLLRSDWQAADTTPDSDDSEPDEPHADTDSSAASSPMGEEHVMELIEHIITSCTPASEANALLGILAKAGTVPWKSMGPYTKTLRAWHKECGRRPVLSKDLGIPVSDTIVYPIFGLEW